MKKMYRKINEILSFSLVSALFFTSALTTRLNAQQQASLYSFSETTETYVPVVGTNSTATGDDGSENAVAIPFVFKFEGITYTTLSINTNGFVRLGSNIGGSPWSNNLGNAAPQRPLLAPFWDDNHRNTGKIEYATSGIAPNRIFEVGWDSINIGGGGSTSSTLLASYKLRIYETTHTIEFIYGPTMDPAGTLTASVGINGTGSFLSVTPGMVSTVSSVTANNTISSTVGLVGKKLIFLPPPPPLCPAPSALTATGITFNSANLGWTENGTATAWNIEWGTTGFTPGSGTLIAGTTTNPHTLSGLSPNTSYEFYVQADCGGNGNSVWIGPFSFFTGYCKPSSTNSTTYINNFSTTNGFLNISNLASGYTTGGYFDGTSQVVSRYANSTFDFNGVIVGGTAGFSIWVDWNNNLILDNATEKVFNTTSYSNGPFSATITVPMGTPIGNYRMRVAVDYNSSNPSLPCAAISTGEFEDYTIAVVTPPSCLPPSVLTATGITSTSANLGWTENGTATTWNIEWGTTGFTPGSGTLITGTTTNPQALSGLSPNTSYEFYVQADCGGNGSSTWSGPFSFTTLCAAFNTFPFTETFETMSASRACWTQQQVAGAANWTYATGAGGGTITSAYAGTMNARFVSQSGTNSPVTKLISPVFDLTSLTTPELSFYYGQEDWAGDQNKLKVYYRISSSDPWVEIFYDSLNVAAWTAKTLSLPNPSATYQIAFEGINNYGRANVVDEVMIVDAASFCSAPSVLTATGITSTSANLGWTENGTATTWNIEWGTTGFLPGSGTLVAGTTTNPHALSGLSANTSYEFYVQADCGGNGNSTWSGPFSFTTLCAALNTFPFLETFEVTSPSRSCWSQIQETGVGTWTYAAGSSGGSITTAQSGLLNARFVSLSGTNSPITKLVSPVFDLTSLTTPELSFYYGQEVWSPDQNKLKVYYRISSSDPWVEIFYDSLNVAAWTAKTLSLPNPSATYQIAFEGINNYGRANVVDEVAIKEGAAPCSAPSNLTAFNITQTSATLDWTENGTATEWDIEWGNQGFTQGTGTVVHVLSKPYVLQPLQPGTPYSFYVRATCGMGDTSVWVGPYNFMTPPCAPIGLELGNDTTLCLDESLTLSAPAGGPWGYAWSTGETTSSITVDTSTFGGAGTYNISVVVIDFITQCQYNDAINVTFSVCVGIKESDNVHFAVYPNPSNGLITVRTSTSNNGTIEISNLQGKVVYKNTLNSNSQIIDMSGQAKGVYFVSVSTPKGVEIQKVILQ